MELVTGLSLGLGTGAQRWGSTRGSPTDSRFPRQKIMCDFAAEVRKKKMAARAVHSPGLAEGLPRSSTQITVWNFLPTSDFAKCPFLSKVVVSRARNDRFAK